MVASCILTGSRHYPHLFADPKPDFSVLDGICNAVFSQCALPTTSAIVLLPPKFLRLVELAIAAVRATRTLTMLNESVMHKTVNDNKSQKEQQPPKQEQQVAEDDSTGSCLCVFAWMRICKCGIWHFVVYLFSNCCAVQR